MTKWLVTGSGGFIGSHFCKFIERLDSVIGTLRPADKNNHEFEQVSLDVLDRNDIHALIKKIQPEIVVHLAGSHDVAWCESEPQKSFLLNARCVEWIGEACLRSNSFLVFLSSDYVFDGTKGRYQLQDLADPKTVYGQNKLEAEKALERLFCRSAIIRTGCVYSTANPQKSLLGVVAKALRNGETFPAYVDVFNSPTSLDDLMQAIQILGNRKLSGKFHLAGSARENRYDFLRMFADEAGFDSGFIQKVVYREVPGFNRPRDISLDSRGSYEKIGFTFLSAKVGLKEAFRRSQGADTA